MILGAGPIVIGERLLLLSAPRHRRRRCRLACCQPPTATLPAPPAPPAPPALLLRPAGQACEFDYSGTQACKALK